MPNLVKQKLARISAQGPRPKLKVRKGDRVVVISGENRGDQGRVIEVIPERMMARVEGIRIVKKHQRADRSKGKVGGIVEIEAPIHVSNLKVIDPTTGKADRVGRKTLDDGTIVRYAKKSGAVLDKQG